MELDKQWNWQKKKLACRIRQETGNPAGDGLREMFAELAGVDLNELLNEMKTTKKKKEATNKVLIDHEGDKNFKEVLTRSRVLGATRLALDDMAEVDLAKANSVTNKNVRKVFQLLPKSPPKRVVLEIQRERSKPLRLPDQNEHKADMDKLEKKLMKQRAARMAAAAGDALRDAEAKKTQADAQKMYELMATCLPEYKGDLFATGGHYLEGMLYLSRMAESSIKSQRMNAALAESERIKKGEVGDDHLTNEADKKNDKKNEKGTGAGGEGGSDDKAAGQEDISNPDLTAKLHCAVSLCNWSRNPANASRLASEGAVRAVIQLCNEKVHRITMFCAAAFRFMSESTELAISMIDEGAIVTIAELVTSNPDDFITTNLAIALVNLTKVNGKEAAVVDSTIVFALMNLIMVKPELGTCCVRGLYNLTCVDSNYLQIERVIRALVSLSLSGTTNVKHLCAAALCNLSDLKVMRPRMVEEGAINVLGALSRGAETRTRRVCAVILQNLSAAKSVRVEMASRNSVTAAYGLSSDQDPIILRCIGLTLSRLAMEPANCQRIIHESGISALGNIAVKYPTIPGITQPVASAFQLLSSQQAYRVSIVNEGSVTAIASLLRSSVDMFTLQHSLLALCNLLCEPENHLPIIQQGLIVTLITMCDQDNDLIKDFCTLAFLNLSCAEESRKHLVNSGAIVAIIRTAQHNSEVTKRRCAATLSNLTYFTVGMVRMVSDGIIPSIVSLVLAKDILTVHYSCAALCRLCSNVENARLILESGAVTNLVQGAVEGDPVTKQFCGAVLSSLSFYETCRVTLCELGTIAALKGLAELNDDLTKQRCLVAFANLSCEMVCARRMIDEGIVSIIAELANSYQEINYICCAKSICNLAVCEGTKLTVARDGGVHALLMISMVQSVDNMTKLLCVLGLNNLLDDTTISFMLSESLVSSIANLSKIEDSNIANLSAKIFNHLSKHADARAKIVEKKSSLNALFTLCNSAAVETQTIAIRTCCNLVLDGFVRKSALEKGALIPLEKGILNANHQKATCLQALIATFSICDNAAFMEMLAKSPTFPAVLIEFASKHSGAKVEYELAVKILTMLMWEEKSRFHLQKKELLDLIINLVRSHLVVDCAHWLALILRFAVLGYSEPVQLVNMGILHSIDAIFYSTTENSPQAFLIYKSLVDAIRTLANCPDVIIDLSHLTTMRILHRAAVVCAADASTMYDIAVILHNFATAGMPSRLNSAIPDTVAIIDALKAYPKTYDLVTLMLGLYLGDVKCRVHFTNEKITQVILKIVESNPVEAVVNNLVLAIYALVKVAACREMLMSPAISMDKVLTKLSLSDSPRIKANCGRAIKNLNADLNEAIEEGAVSSLIAMSLEGKLKNQVSDEFIYPTPAPQVERNIKAPPCVEDVQREVQAALWYETVTVAKGGAAGKGPEPPEAPANCVDGSSAYPNMTEELDGGEAEGKTKMAFAKMGVPKEMRDTHLLTDADFAEILEKDEATLEREREAAAQAAAQEAIALQEAEEARLIAEFEEKMAREKEAADREAASASSKSGKPKVERSASRSTGLRRTNTSGSISGESGNTAPGKDSMPALVRANSSSGKDRESPTRLNSNSYDSPSRVNSANSVELERLSGGESPIALPSINGTPSASAGKSRKKTKFAGDVNKSGEKNGSNEVNSSNMGEHAARLGLYA